jgi:DNA-binding XRE family transcriptional regulator
VVADIKADWALIRERLESGGATQKAIAQEFGVSQQAVSKRAKTWRSIPTHLTGTRSKATPSNLEGIVQGIERGLSLTEAAAIVGVSRQTVYSWKADNPDLADMIEKAEASRISTQLDNMLIAAKTDWRASHQLLKSYAARFRDTTPGGDRSGPGIVVNIGADRLADAITIEN